MKYFLIALISLTFVACKASIPEATVKITNLDANSGGSGTVVSSSRTHSEILTNAHVCGVAAKGGLVHNYQGDEFFITSFKISSKHDLCLITVSAYVGPASHLDAGPPKMYDTSIVSGHPRLYPNIMTWGHFSGKQIIQVMVGSRECTDAEKENERTGLFCLLVGRLPIVKTYETIMVSSLIQAGSSGSAVYGPRGGISAVIFAGSGEIGYGFAVPYEYVSAFLTTEVASLPSLYPNITMSFGSKDEAKKDFVERIKEACDKPKWQENDVCKKFNRTREFNDLVAR